MDATVLVSLQDYFSSMQESMGQFATALSSSVKEYAKTGEVLIDGTEQSAQAMTQIYAKAYQDTAAWAEHFARTAADAGNSELAAIRQGVADHMAQQAAQLLDASKPALVRVENMTNAVNKYLSEAVSPEWKDLKGIGAVFDAAGLLTAALNGDQNKFYEGCVGMVVSEGAAMLGAGTAVGLGLLIGTTTPVWATALAAGAAAYGASILAEKIYGAAQPGFYAAGMTFWEWWYGEYDINAATSTTFTASTRYTQPRRDPLTFDLDGDGLETVGTAAGILFDHDADGVKTGTGWVKADDALLVRDINGNGTIDNGRELFGDATMKSNGQLATDGFDALADLDSNLDGQITSADSAFSSLRLWRDLNQDGISQSGELFTLDDLSIVTFRR